MLYRRRDPVEESRSKAERLNDILVGMESGLPKVHLLRRYFGLFLYEEIASHLSVRILPMFALKSTNGKGPPCLQVLLEEDVVGNLRGMTKYGASSGNAAVCWSSYDELFDFEYVPVFEASALAGKVGQQYLAGAQRVVYAPSHKTAIEHAEFLGSKPGCGVLDQYHLHLPAAIRGHRRWTWAHVLREASYNFEPSVVVLPVGTMALLLSSEILRNRWPEIPILGVACEEGQKISGARPTSKLQVPESIYGKVIDPYPLILCTQSDAMDMTRELYGQDFSAGLTTGMTIAASFRFFNQQYERGGMKALGPFCNPAGVINLFTVAVDAGASYATEFIKDSSLTMGG